MKTQLRLGSVVAHGVGGPEAQAIDLIYMFLLNEFAQDVYGRIGINQIGDDLQELVLKEKNSIHCNIRYPVFDDFETKSVSEKNQIRLDVVHQALLRIAEFDHKLDIQKLEAIKDKILEKNFLFDFVSKIYPNKKNRNLCAKLLIHPEAERFDYYILIEEQGREKCKILIYKGMPVVFFGGDFFSYGTWKDDTNLIIEGKKKEVQIHINTEKCEVQFINLTQYDNPPWFTLMRTDITKDERQKANKDWEDTLPPGFAALIRESKN